MKRNIFMYLFLFVSLWVIFQYVNNTKVYENQQKQIVKLEETNQKYSDSLNVLNERLFTSEYFGLLTNSNAYEYYENDAIDVSAFMPVIIDGVYELNTVNGNVLVPYVGDNRPYQVNQVQVLNHRWIIADFSDGTTWGEVLIAYFRNEDGTIDYETIESLLYP